jgi:hypothetical protein
MIVLTGYILCGQDGDHTRKRPGLLDIDTLQDSVGYPGALDSRVQHTLKNEIVSELGGAVHLFYRIRARLERANDPKRWCFLERGNLRWKRRLACTH